MNLFKRLYQLLGLTSTLLLSLPHGADAQAFQGYTLFSPLNSRNTYLIDMNNTVVHSWTHNRTGGYSVYLLEDGSILRTATSGSSQLNAGGAQGVVQRVDWNGNLLWEYIYSTSTVRAHHDIEPMPNGNVLIIAWEVKTAAQAVQAGLNHSASIWPDHIIEVQPVGTNGGNIVWKWHAWDHLIQDFDPTKNNYGVVANHPELLDINVGSTIGDWMHLNGISYNPTLDQIVVSSHYLHEIYVIDHSTTIQQAASHQGGNSGKGGDFLYRWGKPSNYRAPGSAVFNVVHCAYWVPSGLPGAGNIMAFNNRQNQGTSMVVEIVPPMSGGQYSYTPGMAYGPAAPVWSYTAPGFYSNHLGSNQRLPNGNTLIVQSTSGYLFEVNTNGVTQWSYNRGGEVVRALRYPASYPGLSQLIPVELSSFSAKELSEGISLTWRTESETNNLGFEIQRCLVSDQGDLAHWSTIGFVAGHGTTTLPESYSFLDAPHPSRTAGQRILYRLCQIDTDGSRNYSQVVEIIVNEQAFVLRQNYPNPFNPLTTISFVLPRESYVTLDVFDAVGRQVAMLVNGVRDIGSHAVQFDATGLPSGLYTYRMVADGFVAERKMAVMK